MRISDDRGESVDEDHGGKDAEILRQSDQKST